MSLNSQVFSSTQTAVAPPVAAPQTGDTPDMLLAKLLHAAAGGSGATVVDNTTPQTFNTLGFTVLTDAVFSSMTGLAGYLTTGLTGKTFPAGTQLPFRLSAFTLTSGSVLAIKA